MLLFSRLQIVQNHSIVIPYHVRAALGLHNGTELYLSTIRSPAPSLRNEIIVSPIPLIERGEIWRLRATFKDRPGIMSELLQLLREEGVEVVSSRTTVLEQGQILSLELQLNADAHVAASENTTSEWENAAGPTLSEIRARILARFIEDLDFPFGVRPILTIRRNLPLYRSKIRQEEERGREILRDHRIKISKNLEQHVRDSYEQVYSGVKALAVHMRLPIASILGDAENTVLRIMLIYRNTGHVHVRMRAKNTIGCLHQVTTELRERHFNILRMYTRVINNREQCLTDFLLHLPPEYDEEKNDSRLRRYVSGILKGRGSPLEDFNCEVEFPPFLAKQSHVGSVSKKRRR